ncbi:MAG: hypothetical protein JO250_08745 [Armatimonadetes bacterium]|nr:hypothetical protein [Armatimonadota bacterium]
MPTRFVFEFPPEVEVKRGPVLAAIRQATAQRTLAAVQEALELSSEWLTEHPEDFAVLDAGSDLTRLEEAILRTQQAAPVAAAK